ncbi:MAG: DUF4139 domain-containing protein [Candidatus Krumholzibacteria bacterium]|nr:DUF4139 domain-containing protein [Candidatus Krumholzibacteria bacterium]
MTTRIRPIARPLAALALAGALAAPALAAERVKSTPDARRAVAITIYNDNLALVKDVRDVTLPRGVGELWFEGVAAQIDPTSVHIRSVDAPDRLAVLEQNFEYDLVSPERLLEKYIGRELELVRLLEEKEVTVPARLIGIERGLVYEIDGKIAINPSGRVVLPALPEGLFSRPSLIWMLDSGREKHTVEASYLTAGVGWRADYVAVLAADDKKVDLNGWVTIDNQSGTTYDNATLKLVAGDVHRAEPEAQPRRMALATMEGVAQPQFAEEAFFEYHLYTLERPATIKDRQKKQISLLSASDVAVEKTFVYEAVPSFYGRRGPDTSTKVGVYISIENSEANHMGMPLPKGIVRVYKKDKAGDLQFAGEDRIDHTPEGEKVRVKLGNAFDVVAERVQTDFEVLSSGHLYRSSYKVTLRNHKTEDITVQVIERLAGDWRIENNSHSYEKESSHRVRFDIPVAKKGSAELTYTVLVRY